MNRRICLPALLCMVLVQSIAVAQESGGVHNEAEHAHGGVKHDEPRHRPENTDAHAGHAHPGVDISHPIVTESPLPETKLRLNYSFADGDDGNAHEAALEAEYAFTQNFSVEAVIPYVFIDPDDGSAENGFGDASIAFKLASYAWVDHNLLPAIGLEVALPTADEEKGLGTDHVVELEPFFRVGYWNGPFEVIGTVGVGIPLNQTDEESEEEDFSLSYGLSLLYHVAPTLQALLELHGQSIFGGDDAHSLYISPGVTFQPFDDRSMNIGLGVTLPLTDERDFDYGINVMWILHL